MSDSASCADDSAKRLSRGDRSELAELFTQHRDRLWRIVCFHMHDRLRGRVDPDDVLQEAFLAASSRLKHFSSDGERSPFLWIRWIVRQTLIDVHRRHLDAQMRTAERDVRIPDGDGNAPTSAWLAAQFTAMLTTPSEAVARAELFQSVEQAIESLDPIDREILSLRHFEELTNSEVAEVLGIQQKAASMRYVRAVQRLRESLADISDLTEML